MDPGPKLIFIRVDVGDHLVLGSVEFRCEKAEAVLRIPFARFSSWFSRRRRPKLFFHCFVA